MTHYGTVPLFRDKIYLRRFETADAICCYENGLFGKDMFHPYTNFDDSTKALDEIIAGYDRNDFYMWAIGWHGMAAGYVKCFDIDEDERSVHISFFVAKRHRRMGVASVAVSTVVRYLFSAGFEKIYAECEVAHFEGAFVLRDVGFDPEDFDPAATVIHCVLIEKESTPPIETERLLLRMGKRTDTEALMRIANTDFAKRYNPFSEMTEKDVSNAMDDHTNMVLVEKQSGKVIGVIGIEHDPLRHNNAAAMVDYMLDEAYTKKGYMTEALQAVVDFLLEKGSKDIITARVYAGNTASIRLLERVGFRHEGTLHLASARYDGKVFDNELYSLINPSVRS